MLAGSGFKRAVTSCPNAQGFQEMAHALSARCKPQEDEAAQTLRAPSSKFCIQRVGSETNP